MKHGMYEEITIGDKKFYNIKYDTFVYVCNEEENNLMQKDGLNRLKASDIINSKVILRLEKENKFVTMVTYQYDIKLKTYLFVYYFVQLPEKLFN